MIEKESQVTAKPNFSITQPATVCLHLSLGEVTGANKQMVGCACRPYAAEWKHLGAEKATTGGLEAACHPASIQGGWQGGNCGNFRAITACTADYKILSRKLFCQLAPFTRNSIDRFVEGKSITDRIFTPRQPLALPNPMHHLFINLKTAYDSTDRKKLW